MCGRYAAFLPADAIVALFHTTGPVPNWAPTWNMAPTRDAPVVRLHPESRERRLDLLRWGLVPHWAKDPKAIRMTINARGETIATTRSTTGPDRSSSDIASPPRGGRGRPDFCSIETNGVGPEAHAILVSQR